MPTEALLAPLDPTTCATFMDDLRAAQHAVTFGVATSRATASNTHWDLWTDFCAELGLDPLLEGIADKVVFLQVCLHRHRTGVIAPHNHPVRGRTAEDALRSVGQTFAAMGSPDPRKTPQGDMDFRITRQIRCCKKEDPPPNRVKPVPVVVLLWILHAASSSAFAGTQAIADMIALAFFFLLRPGEHTATPSDTAPFRLADVRLSTGGVYFDLWTATDTQHDAATFVSLTFTTQKNGVRGEVIGLGVSGNPDLCPVRSIVRRIKHLRAHGAVPDTPLSVYFENGAWHRVSPADITHILRAAVIALGPATLGFTPADITARCLRAAGAMALLCAHVDTDLMRLLGRWRSDEMLRCLHVQAEPVMRNFSRLMLQGGNFVLHPNADVPQNPQDSP